MGNKKRKNTTSFLAQGTILAAASLISRVIGLIYRMPLTAIIGDTGNDYYGSAYTIYNILIDKSFDPRKAIIKTNVENLDLIPASVDLAGAEVELVEIEGRERTLKNGLDKIKDNYDYIFIDCPPSLGLLTINSLSAVDSVLIPIQCEFYALEGVSQLVSTIELVKKSLNPKLEIQGVILSMFDGRTNLSLQVVQEVKKYFGGKVYATVIPRNVRLAEAPSYGMPITQYDPKSRGAEAYMDFAEEFLDLEEEDI